MEYQTKKHSISRLELSFERITKSEIDDLTLLFNEARNRKISHSFFQKKYNTAWTGKENIAIVIKDQKGSIIGHLGVLPMYVTINNRVLLAGQISDAVLDPILRGKNVFEQLIIEVSELARKEGLAYLFVSPSPQAVKGFELANWKEVNHFRTYKIKVNTFPLNKIANKFSLSFAYRPFIRLMLSLSTKSDHNFNNSIFDSKTNSVSTSVDYVKHKNYTTNYLVRKNGFTFWFKIEDGIEIGNVSYFPPEKQNSFEKTIVHLAKLLGCHEVKVVTTRKTFLDTTFSNFPFIDGNKIFIKTFDIDEEFDSIVYNGSDFNTF
ncbi:MAG: GNAT family N-acetyltransferase [Bacteroidota bacterium]